MRIAASAAVAAMSLVACDTGDGTELNEPTTPTTLPPIDTAPLPSAPLDAGSPSAPPSSVAVAPPTLPAESLPDTTAPAVLDEPAASSDLTLFAPWVDGGTIDRRHACDGSNIAPALSWAGIPEGTQELAVAFVDETNLSNGRPFIHWVMSGIDPDGDATLGEGEVPVGAAQALNFFGDVAYAGPCPNPAEAHTYRLSVYAVGQQLELTNGTPATEFLDLVETVAIGSASVTGTYSR